MIVCVKTAAPTMPAATPTRRRARSQAEALARAARPERRTTFVLFDCTDRSIQVALPDRRVPSGEPLGQGGSPASADPVRDRAVAGTVSATQRRRAGVRQPLALAPLRVRRIELHTDLTILARLTCALAAASSPARPRRPAADLPAPRAREPGRLEPAECGHFAMPDRALGVLSPAERPAPTPVRAGRSSVSRFGKPGRELAGWLAAC